MDLTVLQWLTAFLPDYIEVISKIEKGGFGEIYRAINHKMARDCILKLAFNPTTLNEEGRGRRVKRFIREANIMSSLQHSGVAKFFGRYELPMPPSGYFSHVIELEFIGGASISKLIESPGKLSPILAASHIADAAYALHYTHDQGIIHRDITPGNIMIDTSGRVVLIDFGLALDPIEPPITREDAMVILGTVGYMSPEQFEAPHNVDRQTDVYGLGATLYHAITNRPPYEGGLLKIMGQVVSGKDPLSPSILVPSLDAELSRIILQSMARNRTTRHRTAEELGDDLRCWLGS